MKVKIARYSGFCFGVKRAVELANAALDCRRRRAYSIGPIIHNPQVVSKLSKLGLKVVKGISDIKNGILVIRSHGIEPQVLKSARQKNIKLIDATCPFVKAAQNIVSLLKKQGYYVVVIGEETHPEVKALVGYAKGMAAVVESVSEAKSFHTNSKRIGVIAQTTQSSANYHAVVKELLKKGFHEIRLFNTICNDTMRRQKEARKIAKNVDVIFVLGGKMSANSKHLAQICAATGTPTYHIEVASHIRPVWLRGKAVAGLVSGASTPEWIMKEAAVKLKRLCRM